MQRMPCNKKVCRQLPTSLTIWHSLPHLLLRAVLLRRGCSDRRPDGGAAIDRYLLAAGPQQQTRSSGVWRPRMGRTDRRTDGRMTAT